MFQQYPPNQYPIYCCFMFSKVHKHLIQEFKELVSPIPKTSYRYKKVENKYVGITIHIFLDKVDTLRPIAQGLKEKDLYIDYLLEESKKVFPQTLIDMAQSIMNRGRNL